MAVLAACGESCSGSDRPSGSGSVSKIPRQTSGLPPVLVLDSLPDSSLSPTSNFHHRLLGVVGSRVWSVASISWFSGQFGSLRAFWGTLTPLEVLGRGGLVWYGGFLTVLLWLLSLHRWLPSRRYGDLVDVAALMACLAQAVARVGCFLSGCSFGTWSDLPWAVYVRQGPFFSLVPRHPTNLYVGVAHLFLFAFLLRRDRTKKVAGVVLTELLIGHGGIRFINAFFRTVPEIAFGLSSQHWVSLGLLVLGCLGRWRLIQKGRRLLPRKKASSTPRAPFLSTARIGVSALGTLVVVLGSFAVLDVAALGKAPRSLAERFSMQDLDGNSVALNSLQGRPVVLNLWASWCVPCRKEIPTLNRFARNHAEVTVLGGNVGEEKSIVLRAIDRLQIEFPVLRVEASVARELGARSLPRTVILGPNGELSEVHVGAITEEQLATLIKQIPK